MRHTYSNDSGCPVGRPVTFFCAPRIRYAGRCRIGQSQDYRGVSPFTCINLYRRNAIHLLTISSNSGDGHLLLTMTSDRMASIS